MQAVKAGPGEVSFFVGKGEKQLRRITARRRSLVPATMSAALAAACAMPPPAAAQDHPLELRLRSVIAWDANVFRLPESAPDPQLARGISGKSDRRAATTVGVVLDKSYSQQRIQLELAQTATRYEKFSSLDHDAFEYRAGWQWHLTPRISGSLNASRSESQVSFEDAQGAQRIVRVTANRSASLEGWLFGGWYVQAGASEVKTSSSQVFLAVPDSNQTGGQLGLRYVFPSQSSITLSSRSSQGTNVAQAGAIAAGAFTQREHELLATWVASGKSTLDGRLTRTERRYENLPEGDFSGVAGQLGFAWTPTRQLSLNVAASRALTPFFAAGSTHRIDSAFSVAPVWRLSPKTTLRARAERRESDFRGADAALAGSGRRDVQRDVEIGADWAAHPKVSLSAALRRDQRVSTEAAFNFRTTVATLSAALSF